MSKSQFYLSECVDTAMKSSMCFTLGAIVVKGGKVISRGHNHYRPHYDGSEVDTHGLRKPVSMHAEMHAIFNCTGVAPTFKAQLQGIESRVLRAERKQKQHQRQRQQQQEDDYTLDTQPFIVASL
ncbi:hypothetical protein EIP91_011991 [Steccherinum ochraceum]|uniref:CMP/dCMP-type deaminase domain-containing protein n=1 Tax=Steccherinum ochraceum TaxID=92696 RepID=A0A4R0RQR1_9APHY|nr:hypothetical protein EIP91_011991 [Steccherinum ochraceum]